MNSNIINDINNDYFEWLFDIVCGSVCNEKISYRRLMMELHSIDFRYIIDRDENRANDGLDLRYRFSVEKDCGKDISKYIIGPCSVFEMIAALAIRCEETIMDDPRYGDRTAQWFWGMINNLGLGSMIDSNFDKDYVHEVVDTFLDRKYAPNGRGGLFTVRNCGDLRKVEIWCQLNWYLDSII